MGPFLVAGATCFGGAVAIGLITAAAVGAHATTENPAAVRAIFILSVAFREGIGVLGVVIGILAVTLVGVGNAQSGIVVAVPAVGGALVGAILALREGPDGSGLRVLGLNFIVGLGTLGVVVAMLGILMGGAASSIAGGDAPFVLVAVVLLIVQLAAGAVAAGDVEAIGRAPSGGASAVGTPGTLEYVRARSIRMALLLQTISIPAVAVAIVLLALSPQRP